VSALGVSDFARVLATLKVDAPQTAHRRLRRLLRKP
jgi:hypothetical protein